MMQSAMPLSKVNSFSQLPCRSWCAAPLLGHERNHRMISAAERLAHLVDLLPATIREHLVECAHCFVPHLLETLVRSADTVANTFSDSLAHGTASLALLRWRAA
jgi:hypothetical protein